MAENKEEKKQKEKKPQKPIHEVTFYTYPKLLFAWPLIALGYLLWLPAHIAERSEPDAVQVSVDNVEAATKAVEEAAADKETSKGSLEVMAWIWGVALLMVILTMGVDINRNYAIFWLIVLIALWFLILWLGAKGITLFASIYTFFKDLDPQYSGNLGLIISIPLTIAFGVMWIWTRLNSRWRITHNEFEHYQFGRMDDSIARGAKRLRSSYPDFFELIICLAGDLVIFDASGRKEIRRIQHVPLLPLVKKKINLLLEATAVTQSELEDEQGAQEEYEEAVDASDSFDEPPTRD